MLPEKYVVKTENSEQTTIVANEIKLPKHREEKWSHWQFIYWDKNHADAVLWNSISNQNRQGVENWNVYSYEEWKELYYKKEFVLPETWWVRVTKETEEILSEWRGAKVVEGKLVGMCRWTNVGYCEKGHNSIGLTEENNYTFGQEITFEQFKEYVLGEKQYTIEECREQRIYIECTSTEQAEQLAKAIGYNEDWRVGNGKTFYVMYDVFSKNQECPGWTAYKEWYPENANATKLIKFEQIKFKNMNQNKKLIGYIAPTDLFGDKIAKGTVYSIDAAQNAPAYNTYSPVGNLDSHLNLPLEIIQNWQPLYEEIIPSKEIQIGVPARKCIVFKDKVEVISGGGKKYTFTNKDVDTMQARFNQFSFRGLDCNVEKINIGCQDGLEITKTTIDKIKQIQQSL